MVSVSSSVSDGSVSVSGAVSGAASTGRNKNKPDLAPLSVQLKLVGLRVSVVPPEHLSNRLEKIEGHIVRGGKIRTTGRSTTGIASEMTVSDFAKHGGQASNAWNFVMVENVPNKAALFPGLAARPNFSLRELWAKFLEQGGTHKNTLMDAFQQLVLPGGGSVRTVADLTEWNVTCLSPPLMEQQVHTAYRVLRPDEDIKDGIAFHPGVKDGAYKEGTPALVFAGALNEHVGHGTRAKTPKAMISATRSMETAIWWSGLGVLRIVRIDLAEVCKQSLPQWHVGGAHGELLYPQQRHYAGASQEVVFTTPIPREAVEEYTVKWKVVNGFFDSRSKPGDFPPAKALELKNIEFLEILNGSTVPLKVKVSWVDKKKIYNKVFVLKRGGKMEKEGVQPGLHTSSEYLSNMMYKMMGVHVPLMGLYTAVVTGGGNETMGSFYFTLVEFIEGRHPVTAADKDECKKTLVRGYVADLVLGNEDVVGDNMENLLISKENHVVRIDCGGCLQFGPTGKIKEHGFSATGVTDDINRFLRIPGKCSANQLRVELYAGLANDSPESVAFVHAQVKDILETKRFEKNMELEIAQQQAPPDWMDQVRIVSARLKNMASGADNAISTSIFSGAPPAAAASSSIVAASNQGSSSSAQPEAVVTVKSEEEISVADIPSGAVIEVAGRKAYFDKNGAVKKNPPDGFDMIDVTSYSTTEYKQLSPFYPHGTIRVPFMGNDMDPIYSASVEGAWQGLKMFEKKEEGVCFKSFEHNTGVAKGLKRGGRQAKANGVCHYGGPRANGTGAISKTTKHSKGLGLNGVHLNYVDARKQIYLPTYAKVLVLKHNLRLINDLRKKLVAGRKLILLDIYTSGDVENPDGPPLSHAQLLRNYILTGDVESQPATARKRKIAAAAAAAGQSACTKASSKRPARSSAKGKQPVALAFSDPATSA